MMMIMMTPLVSCS